MTPHQIDAVKALVQIPDGIEFTAGDLKKHGYPHNDAAKVLQQSSILGTFVSYHGDGYRAGKIRYERHRHFDLHRSLVALQHPELEA